MIFSIIETRVHDVCLCNVKWVGSTKDDGKGS